MNCFFIIQIPALLIYFNFFNCLHNTKFVWKLLTFDLILSITMTFLNPTSLKTSILRASFYSFIRLILFQRSNSHRVQKTAGPTSDIANIIQTVHKRWCSPAQKIAFCNTSIGRSWSWSVKISGLLERRIS
jgi:hypothetical protein